VANPKFVSHNFNRRPMSISSENLADNQQSKGTMLIERRRPIEQNVDRFTKLTNPTGS
jgi:hypothetical protein